MSATPPPPAPRRPSPADDPARARAGRLLVWQSGALMGMVLAFSLVLPWKVLALVLALVALALGVAVFGAARRAEGARTARAAAATGIAVAALGALVAALPLLAWNETTALERCSASALTVRAQQECAAEFTRQVEGRTGIPQLRP